MTREVPEIEKGVLVPPKWVGPLSKWPALVARMEEGDSVVVSSQSLACYLAYDLIAGKHGGTPHYAVTYREAPASDGTSRIRVWKLGPKPTGASDSLRELVDSVEDRRDD